MGIKLLEITMHDGSRHFASLPESCSFTSLRNHLVRLPDVMVTGFLSDRVMEVWIDFTYRGHAFTINNQYGQYWFFVQKPDCPEAVLSEVVDHCGALLGGLPVTKLAEVRVGKLAANGIGLVITVIFCGLFVGIARMLPHYAPFAESQVTWLMVLLIILLPAHEGLHAIGLILFARVSWPQIRFGMMWRALMPYCHCKVPISVSAYRRMALLPLWVTGAASVGALLAWPSDCLGVFAGMAVAACCGDVWLVARLRSFPADVLVQDSPSEIGCDVIRRN